MPPGTPAEKVLKAVRKLAVNEWQLKHRYAMALHTDDDHPHVHVVLKAVSEQSKRLNIRKATLRSWRAQFAANLRELGVAANATDRAVRGQSITRKLDGIYRAAQRGESTHLRARHLQAMRDLAQGNLDTESGHDTIRRTRSEVVEGWKQVALNLRASGDHALADRIRVFVSGMAPPQSERAWLVAQLREDKPSRREATQEQTR
jgi:hypothetical protein